MPVEAALVAWSGLALLWWIISWRLAAGSAAGAGLGREVADADAAHPPKALTVFKPLPPQAEQPFPMRGIESFLAQLDEHSELLLGVHLLDRGRIEPWIECSRRQFPNKKLRVIWRDEPDSVANPKIAWLRILAPHAHGDLWLWSDADIIAPAHFLSGAREAYVSSSARLLTWPYVVREAAGLPALLDALYVNVELFPGVLLLRRLGRVDFGLGAALLFRRSDFESAVTWLEVGSALADDFVLGQRLGPVRIGAAILTTTATISTWGEAMLHYLRWSKTVRWSRPGGTAARITVLPVIGWAMLAICQPAEAAGWLGLAVTMQMDVIFACLICRQVGLRPGWGDLACLQGWSLGRALVWVLCWLPWPVVWAGRRWWRPFDKA